MPVLRAGRVPQSAAVDPARPVRVNPANFPVRNRRVFDRVAARLNATLSGVSRDATGAPLGFCRILIFREIDNTLAASTISDANGSWSVPLLTGGPFYAHEDFPAPVSKRLYFHTEATLQGAPAAPAGCATISELVPDQLDSAGQAGGHLSTSAAVATSELNKPATKDETGVTGTPPLDVVPQTAHQFGWFSDVKYNGQFDGADLTFQWREDDDSNGIVGRAIINLFASTTRDFANIRFLAQLDPKTTDWWIAATNAVGSWAVPTPFVVTMNDEYLFVQLWCYESSGLAAGKTLTFNQEGSDLANDARSWILLPQFWSFVNRVAGTNALPMNVVAVGG